ncbi:MAG TPA: adventurous gliding motility protein CglF [Anaeromyxobacter sp.]
MRKLVVATLVLLPLLGSAQEKKGEAQPKVEYEKKTVINFEDDTIEGDLKRPDGEYVEARQKVDHSNLIKIREDWRDKVMQASGDL